MAMHKMIGRMEEMPSNRPSSFMWMEYLTQVFFFVGLLSLVESAFRGAENEQGLVAWELACHRYPAVGHGMPTSSSLLFFYLSFSCARGEKAAD